MQELRAEAKSAGVPTSEIRSAESVEELQGLIAGYASTTRKGGKVAVAKKKTVAKKTVAKRGPGRPRKTTTVAKRGPGRPKGSTSKKSTTRKTTVTKAKALTNGRKRHVESTDGRHILSGVKYSVTDGWNPRKGSAPDVILNALRKNKGNREATFNALKSRVWDFVGKKMQDGSKRSLSSAHDMLRYRIARTDWDFALKTGQHEKSGNRVEYGTGGTGAGTFKRAKKSTRKASVATPKRRGRPAKAQATPKRRGRPPGSKNRSTTTRKPAAKKTMKRR
jgi:hypothetical protein